MPPLSHLPGWAQGRIRGLIFKLRHYQEFDTALDSFETRALAHPYDHTDILGSIDLAAQEFAMDSPNTRKRFVIFSDFIEDDGKLNFMTDPRLATVKKAEGFANQVGKKIPNLQNVSTLLAQLQSKEFRMISKTRIEAVQIFWLFFLKNDGANSKIVFDGPGLSTFQFFSQRVCKKNSAFSPSYIYTTFVWELPHEAMEMWIP